jgi:uncharacterized membrane protein
MRHKPDCRMVFGRKDPSCPRCQELLAGAAPIQWRGTRRAQERRTIEAIRSHDFAACARQHGVCTHFDY